MKRREYLWLIALVLPFSLQATELRVAVAANFSAPMKIIARDFERDTGHRAIVIPGATGHLYAQIRNGAPYAVLLAADNETPLKLEKEGLAVPGTRFTYATGKLVLWSRTPGFVDAAGDILRSGQFGKLAMSNPKLAPYGAAAMATLEKMGLRGQLAPKIVEGASISQTFQFVSSGNAELGFIALSQVFENGGIKEGSGWIVPGSLHSPIKQDAALLVSGKDNAAATAMLRYLQLEKTRALIRSFGYELP